MAFTAPLGQAVLPRMNEVVDTPLGIYRIVRGQFPCARILVISARPIILDISLTGGEAIEMRIDRAVRSDLLRISLMEAKLNPRLNPRLDFVAQPLLGLQEFTQEQRQIYESSDERCLNVIVQYLRGQELVSSPILMTLGLAPGQLTVEMALPYFREIGQRFADLVPSLKVCYPEIFSLVQLAFCQQNLNRSPSKLAVQAQEICAVMRKRVVGQEAAIQQVANVLLGGTEKHKAFLFVGPPGVGKSELAAAAGSVKRKFVPYYMNQYMLEHETARFFGAPTGYQGSSDKSDFAKDLDQCRDLSSPSLASSGTIEIRDIALLFDELEKAHPKLRQSLLTILEKGEFTASYTNSGKNIKILYKLINSVVFATSNLFANEIMVAFQQGMSSDKIAKRFVQLNKSNPLGNTYSGELLSRVTVIPFGPIPREIFGRLLEPKIHRFLQEVQRRFSFREVVAEDERQFLTYLQDKLYEDGTDLRRIEKHFGAIESKITMSLVNWGDSTDKKVIFYPEGNRLWVKLHQFCFGEYCDLSSCLAPSAVD